MYHRHLLYFLVFVFKDAVKKAIPNVFDVKNPRKRAGHVRFFVVTEEQVVDVRSTTLLNLDDDNNDMRRCLHWTWNDELYIVLYLTSILLRERAEGVRGKIGRASCREREEIS